MATLVLQTYEKILGTSPYLAVGYVNRGIILCNLGKVDQAGEDISKALYDRQKMFGKVNSVVANTLVVLGNLKLKAKRYSEATELFEKSYEIRKEIFGPNHFELAKALDRLGVSAFAQDQTESAKAYFENGNSILQKNPAGKRVYGRILLTHLAEALERLHDEVGASGTRADASKLHLAKYVSRPTQLPYIAREKSRSVGISGLCEKNGAQGRIAVSFI